MHRSLSKLWVTDIYILFVGRNPLAGFDYFNIVTMRNRWIDPPASCGLPFAGCRPKNPDRSGDLSLLADLQLFENLFESIKDVEINGDSTGNGIEVMVRGK